jgi:hypothetical protein
MTLEKLRDKARELHQKTRKQLMGNLAVPLFVVAFCIYGATQFPALRWSFGVAAAWSFTGLYFLNRGMWSTEMPGDAGLSTSLESYRQEIERRRHLFRRLELCSFAPMILGIGTFILALTRIGIRNQGTLPKALPFLSLVVVWVLAYFVIRMREQRELRREIDELDKTERKGLR